MERSPWERVVSAETAYLIAVGEMRDAGLEEQLRLAWRSRKGSRMVMNLLMTEPPEQSMPFLPQLFDLATRINGQVGYARDVVERINSGWLFIALTPLIAAALDAPEADDDDYRRIAEALDQWDQRKHLADLVARAEKSTDPHVLEVAADYRGGFYAPAAFDDSAS